MPDQPARLPDPPLATRWTKLVETSCPWPEHPRPHFRRPDWMSLNGPWQCTIYPRDVAFDARNSASPSFSGTIIVPFCVESWLSGVQRMLKPAERLWYGRTFRLPAAWQAVPAKRILLHFGAIDWQAEVHVNGQGAGSHAGGYTPFTLDITDLVSRDGDNELVVIAWDPSETGNQEKGKQTTKPGGILYTPTSGIWQTAWLELVPETSIASWTYRASIDWDATPRSNANPVARAATLHLSFALHRPKGQSLASSHGGQVQQVRVRIHAPADPEEFHAAGRGKSDRPIIDAVVPVDGTGSITIPAPSLWAPGHPALYPVVLQLVQNGTPFDEVFSYLGIRSVRLSEGNCPRILINEEPVFQLGLLDQGYWPDGIYTAPTADAMRHDIDVSLQAGFNMIRKHVKVEPAAWYYHCDRVGMLVWQDMPSGGRFNPIAAAARYIAFHRLTPGRDAASKEQFLRELDAMIAVLANHPSIITWVPFNESWGQFDTRAIADHVKAIDPTRLVDCPSGFFDEGAGNLCDRHVYFIMPYFPRGVKGRAVAIGEMGGYGYPVPGHAWPFKRAFQYGKTFNAFSFKKTYERLVARVKELEAKGLSAAIYTQTTDVEQEINGLMTYDREVVKIPVDELARINLAAFPPTRP